MCVFVCECVCVCVGGGGTLPSPLPVSFHLTLKPLGGINLTHPLWFFEKCSSKERVTPWFLVTFKFIKIHIFPECLIEISQFVKKI